MRILTKPRHQKGLCMCISASQNRDAHAFQTEFTYRIYSLSRSLKKCPKMRNFAKTRI